MTTKRGVQRPALVTGGDWLTAAVAGLSRARSTCRVQRRVFTGDSGEFQFAAWLAGLPHPTGYPLYMLLGWAWSHGLTALGIASPAAAMNLLSAVFGGLAVALATLFFLALVATLTGEETSGSRWLLRGAALAAALVFAFTPTFWSQALIAEVYTLHAALVAAILWLALLWRKDQLARDGVSPLLWALSLATGLSLAHHRTMVLLLPVLVVYLWAVAGSRYWRNHWQGALIAAGLLVAPLLLYLYVPLRAGHSPWLTLAWQPGQTLNLLDRSPAGLVGYVLGRGFAGELHGLNHALAQTAQLPNRLVGELTWFGVALAAVGALILAARRCWSVLWLTGAGFTAFIGFNLFYAIGDIAVFYIPAYLLACGWMAVTVAWLAEKLASRGRLGRWLPAVVVLVFIALPLLVFVREAASQSRSQDTDAAERWSALLTADPPSDAVLISNDRDDLMPLWYFQQVDGIRPDLAGVFPQLLPDPDWSNIGRVLDSALATGRPVYLIKPMPGLEILARLDDADASGLTPVLGHAVTGSPATPTDASIGDDVRLLGYDVQPAGPQPGDTLTVDLYWQASQPVDADLTSFVQLLASSDEKVAQSDHQPGGVFYPSSMWRPGEMLLDRHELTIPADAAPGPYRLLIGLYRLTEAGIESLGQTTFDLVAASS
ncbi:MAG: DUF2723 domain-containing protein [Anaerolineae bacterium]|nr:DUF2723 domain-containing protein [Anaerolineae bacterium]